MRKVNFLTCPTVWEVFLREPVSTAYFHPQNTVTQVFIQTGGSNDGGALNLEIEIWGKAKESSSTKALKPGAQLKASWSRNSPRQKAGGKILRTVISDSLL